MTYLAADFRRLATSGDVEAMGAGSRLVSVVVGTGAASAVVTIYNNGSAAGQKVATINAAASGSYWFGGIRCSAGIYAVLSGGNADVTICYA